MSEPLKTELDTETARALVLKGLKYAMHMTLLGQPISSKGAAFVEGVAADLLKREEGNRRDRGVRRSKFVSAVSAVVIDLLTAAARPVTIQDNSKPDVPAMSARGWAYHGRHTDYFHDVDHDISKRLFSDSVDALEQAGLLEQVRGISFQGAFAEKTDAGVSTAGKYETHRATRYRATDALVQRAREAGLPSSSYRKHFKHGLPTTVIELREPAKWVDQSSGSRKKEKGKRIRLAPSPRIDALAAEIHELNDFTDGMDLAGGWHWALRRIFNDGEKDNPLFDKGGRLYSAGPDNYQQDPKAVRRLMRIDGSPVCEIDVNSSLLTILWGLQWHRHYEAFALLDWEGGGDLYALPGIPNRGVGKAWFTVAIGLHRLPKKWTAARVADYRDATNGKDRLTKYPVATVAKKMLERHPVIARWLADPSCSSKDLMFIESNIILNTLLRLKRGHGIKALPVHDSLIVKVQDAEIAAGVLKAEFEDLGRIIPRLSIQVPEGSKIGFDLAKLEPLRTKDQKYRRDPANW